MVLRLFPDDRSFGIVPNRTQSIEQGESIRSGRKRNSVGSGNWYSLASGELRRAEQPHLPWASRTSGSLDVAGGSDDLRIGRELQGPGFEMFTWLPIKNGRFQKAPGEYVLQSMYADRIDPVESHPLAIGGDGKFVDVLQAGQFGFFLASLPIPAHDPVSRAGNGDERIGSWQQAECVQVS